ncbi:MAG: LytTR family DNA-binding domain-containing protein [Ruthenibacterium sp.]
MYRLSICDDDVHLSQELFTQIKKKYGKLFEMRCYAQASILLSDLDLDVFIPDIILMDIEYGTTNGVVLAEKINQKRAAIQFIFVTGYNERYSQKIFLHHISLIGYVAKPIEADILFANIDNALVSVQKDRQSALMITNKSGVRAVPQNEIVFIESVGHSLLVHTKQEILSYVGKLDEAEKCLSDTFVRVHKSFLVNLCYVESIANREVLLPKGQKTPISRNRLVMTRTAYFTYWGLRI